MGGEEEKALHQEDQNSLPNEFEKDEETLHEKEEEYLETIEYHSETNSTMDMDQRASTDGCLNYGVPTDRCSQFYVGGIEIRLENFVAIQIFQKHEYGYLVTDNEEPISTSPSPLELQ